MEAPKKPRVPRKLKPRPERKRTSPWANKTPEQVAEWKANLAIALKGKRGRPKGLPDGIGKKAYDAQVAAEAPNIKLIVERIMADNDLNPIEDKYAVEALETAVTIMRVESANRDKLAAAKLVLEYTKAKPSTKADITLNTAESFLESVLAQELAEGK